MNVEQMFSLQGQVSVITGGGRGLGKQIAEIYAEQGSNIAICSRREEQLRDTATYLRDTYDVKVEYYVLDVASEENVNEVVEQIINDFGKVDILVNNSGATWGAPVEEMPKEAWDKVIDVNVTGTFLMSKAIGKHMIERGEGGNIINIASVAGMRAPSTINTIGYSTSKAAVIHFTKDLALKWAQHNIRVNAISPGMFRTKMTAGTLDAYEEEILDGVPLKKIGDEQMLKGTALYLATDASEFVTGVTIPVDGGSVL